MHLESFHQCGEQRLADRDRSGVYPLGEQSVQSCPVLVGGQGSGLGLGQPEHQLGDPAFGLVEVDAQVARAGAVELGVEPVGLVVVLIELLDLLGSSAQRGVSMGC